MSRLGDLPVQDLFQRVDPLAVFIEDVLWQLSALL